MPDLLIQLTTEELRRLNLAAAALGKTPEQMVSDELHDRYALMTQASDVRAFPGSKEVRHG